MESVSKLELEQLQFLRSLESIITLVDYQGNIVQKKTSDGTRKLALHIAVNELDSDYYQGWNGKLTGPENDAVAMELITQAAGYETKSLLTKEATREAVIEAFIEFSEILEPNDSLVFTYAGHGNHHPDKSGDEADHCDETWCLYNGELFDDELGGLLTKFKPQVNILALLDCCHSGTMTRDHADLFTTSAKRIQYDGDTWLQSEEENDAAQVSVREVPEEFRMPIWEANEESHTLVKMSELANTETDVSANVVLFSACDDDQKAAERFARGLFSQAIESAWNRGTFSGSYVDFYDELRAQLPMHQTPQASFVGTNNPITNGDKFRF